MDLLSLNDQLVTLQVVVKADLLVCCEVAVRALVLFLEHVVRMVFHMPFQETPRFELLSTDVAGIHRQGLPIRTNDHSWREDIRNKITSPLTHSK